MWHVYILETLDGRLYTGITNNLERRMKEHERGRGGRFTRVFGFKELLFSQKVPSRAAALTREAEIKRWPRTKKLALIGLQD